MHSVEITLQHPRNATFPVVAEHRRAGELPARAEGALLPMRAVADLAAFESELIQLQDKPRD